MNKSVPLIGLLAAFGVFTAQAYELATHGAVTWHAYKKSVLGRDSELWKNFGIDLSKDNVFGSVYYDISGAQGQEKVVSEFEKEIIEVDLSNFGAKHLTPMGWLLRGAIREDDWTGVNIPLICSVQADNPQDDNIDRPLDHFFDPFRNIPLTVFGSARGQTAPDWATGAVDAFNQPNTPRTNRANHYTIFDAREAMYRALTGRNQAGDVVAATKELRNRYWATTFRALGDVVHLIQDMAQPQHTRNDVARGNLPGRYV